MNTKEVIDRIFKAPGIQYELTEFQDLGKPIHVYKLIQHYGYRPDEIDLEKSEPAPSSRPSCTRQSRKT